MFVKKMCQSGEVKCPICGNKIEWKCSVELGVLENGRIAIAKDCSPYGAVWYKGLTDGKVIFSIGCLNCGCTIETEKMDLIKK